MRPCCVRVGPSPMWLLSLEEETRRAPPMNTLPRQRLEEHTYEVSGQPSKARRETGTVSPSQSSVVPTLKNSCFQNCEKIDVRCFQLSDLWCVVVVGYALENLIQLWRFQWPPGEGESQVNGTVSCHCPRRGHTVMEKQTYASGAVGPMEDSGLPALGPDRNDFQSWAGFLACLELLVPHPYGAGHRYSLTLFVSSQSPLSISSW